MRSSRDIVEPGDLCAVLYSYRVTVGVAVAWTPKSFQYFSIKDGDRKLDMYKIDTIEEYFEEIWNPYKSYIHGDKMNQRVIPVSEKVLSDGQQKYYDGLMEMYKDNITVT